MRAVIKSHKVGKLIDPVPLDFQRRRIMVRPGLHDRLQSSGLDTDISVASDALLDRRRHRKLRHPRRRVAVKARYLIDARMQPMAKRDWLHHVLARQPWPR